MSHRSTWTLTEPSTLSPFLKSNQICAYGLSGSNCLSLVHCLLTESQETLPEWLDTLSAGFWYPLAPFKEYPRVASSYSLFKSPWFHNYGFVSCDTRLHIERATTAPLCQFWGPFCGRQSWTIFPDPFSCALVNLTLLSLEIAIFFVLLVLLSSPSTVLCRQSDSLVHVYFISLIWSTIAGLFLKLGDGISFYVFLVFLFLILGLVTIGWVPSYRPVWFCSIWTGSLVAGSISSSGARFHNPLFILGLLKK